LACEGAGGLMVNSQQAKAKFAALGNVFVGGGLATGTAATPVVIDAKERWKQRSIYLFYVVNIICSVFLQKLAIPGNLSLIYPVELATTIALLFTAGMSFSVERVVLYCAFIGAAIFSQLLGGTPFSIPSLLMVVGIYAPLCVHYNVDEELFRKCMRFFISSMLIICVIVWVEHAIQLLASARYWVNLDAIIPYPLQFRSYSYIRQLTGKYLEPNGIFFLEPSILSQFLALALIIEFRIFRRWLNITVLGLSLLATFAGSGLLMVLACAPFLIPRMSMRTFLSALIGGSITTIVLVATGWLTRATGRLGEFGEHNRSANERFVAPMERLADTLKKPDAIFHGSGAGSIPIGSGQVWWPFTKDVVEYGLLTAVTFYIFLAWSVIKGSRDIAISIATLVAFSFLGAVPPTVTNMMLFCTLLRVRRT
jgi:hypothetical protein